MRFRPCIDLHAGKVKQIVGSTLRDATTSKPEERSASGDTSSAGEAVTNFEADQPSDFFAKLYQRDGLTGGHVIKLGPGNEEAALAALKAYPGGLQLGGGVTPANAKEYLDAGASHVIVTSYVFSGGRIDWDRLGALEAAVGRERLVLDVSCRRRKRKRRSSEGAAVEVDEVVGAAGDEVAAGDAVEAGTELVVVTDRWQKWTDEVVDTGLLKRLGEHCAELLVHGVDVEGKQAGVDLGLVRLLGEACAVPVTYAGGVRSLEDCEVVRREGRGRVDLAIGSALDVFGGPLKYEDVLAWFREHGEEEAGGVGGEGSAAKGGAGEAGGD